MSFSFEKYKSLIIIVAVLLLLIIAALYIPTYMENKKNQQQAKDNQKMREYAISVSDQIQSFFTSNVHKLNELSKEPTIIDFFQNYDENKGDEIANKLISRFEHGLKLRLLSPDVSKTYKEEPPLTFASIEMIHRAMKSDSSIPIEWLFPNNETEHIVIVQRVNDKMGEAIGGLQLSLNTDPVRTLFNQAASKDTYFIKLLQNTSSGGSVVLASSGDKNRATVDQNTKIPVTGTRWSIDIKRYPVVDKSNITSIGLIGLIALLGALLISYRKQQNKKKLAESLANRPRAPSSVPEEQPSPKPENEIFDNRLTTESGGIEVEEIDGVDEDSAKEVAKEIEQTNFDQIDEATHAPASIFRAYDIRGVVDETLTEQIVYNIGRALGSEAIARGDNTVAVGRDGRLSSPALSEALVKGLTDSGRDVIDIGMVPTPVLYFAANYFDTSSGIMITGSHNPPNYNGIKMVLAGTTLADDAIQSLRQRILDSDFTTGEGKAQTTEIGSEYVRRITEDIPVALSNSFKVVVDAGNGVAGQLAPQLIRALGHDVIELFCEIDGNFPNHHPDPSQPENLEDLIKTVKDQKADLGFAFDGDGDRLGVVDRDGNIIWPDRQMMLFSRDVIERNPGGEIIFDVKCSNHLKRVIEEAGGKATMWKTGHSLIKAKMKETGALLAGEMSGHVFFKERWYGFDDGLYTAARLLEILTKADQEPHEILGSLPGGVSTPELKVDMHEDQHGAFMASLGEIADFGNGNIGTIDGIRVDFPDGWGLIRPSNTTPCLVMRFEADNEAALTRVQELFREQLLALDPKLKLPY
ncbi:MAG: phosphomannomutase/phosphoglucomutase [Gammaproteobacteria bacterium]